MLFLEAAEATVDIGLDIDVVCSYCDTEFVHFLEVMAQILLAARFGVQPRTVLAEMRRRHYSRSSRSGEKLNNWIGLLVSCCRGKNRGKAAWLSIKKEQAHKDHGDLGVWSETLTRQTMVAAMLHRLPRLER